MPIRITVLTTGLVKPHNLVEITEMVDLFEIFQREANGKLRWIEAAESLEAAQVLIQKFMGLSPGEYVILSQKTQNKILITFRILARPAEYASFY